MINFENLKEICISEMNGGNGITKARMFADNNLKIMISTLGFGCSIGEHKHSTSCEIVYIISGEALCTIDGKEEIVKAGECHYCPKDSVHSISKITATDLVMFDIVPEM